MKTITKALLAAIAGVGSLTAAEAGSYGTADYTANGIAVGGCYGGRCGTPVPSAYHTGYGSVGRAGYDDCGYDRYDVPAYRPRSAASCDWRDDRYVDRFDDRLGSRFDDRCTYDSAWNMPARPSRLDRCEDNYLPYSVPEPGSVPKLGSAWPGRSTGSYHDSLWRR